MNKRNTLYFLAAIPAGYLSVVYIIFVFWVFMEFFISGPFNTENNAIFKFICYSGIYATFIQWPVYILWVVFSKNLTSRLKVLWLLIIVLFNMLAIPFFLYCKFKTITHIVLIKNIKNVKLKSWLLKRKKV